MTRTRLLTAPFYPRWLGCTELNEHRNGYADNVAGLISHDLVGVLLSELSNDLLRVPLTGGGLVSMRLATEACNPRPAHIRTHETGRDQFMIDR